MHKPNNVLELDVKEELDWDPMLDDTRMVVDADDGRVTLSGTVPSFYEATRAVDDAWTVGGVRDVDNELLVGLVGGAVADADIAAACARALDADKFVPKGSVTVEANDGWVTLGGCVITFSGRLRNSPRAGSTASLASWITSRSRASPSRATSPTVSRKRSGATPSWTTR
jgi:hypothetical protein